MTDQQLEQRLRTWYRAEIDEAERAPATLRASVAVIPRSGSTSERRLTWPFPTLGLQTRFAVAAVIGIIAVGGAFYLLRPSPPDVGTPSPTPGLSAIPSQPTSSSVVPARAASWTVTASSVSSDVGTATLLLNGKVLVASGSGYGTAADMAAQLYDPAIGSWTATGSMLIPGAGGTATLLRDGRVLMVGGGGAAAELYDPGTGGWTRTGSMTTARGGFSATLLRDGRVLVAGGNKDVIDGNAVELASAELYDPSSGTWTATGSMVATRFSHTATLLPDGRVLVAGGGGLARGATICCDPLPSAELYDPGTGTWTATGDMTTARVDHTATLLLDGRVLVAAGGTAAELYNPGTGTWTTTGPMATTAVAYFSATLLPDGKVLLAGGWAFRLDAQQNPIALASAELYDPASGTWTATASMAIPRMHHTATLLPNGRVLVSGGTNPGGALASAELFDPGTGQ
jgi:hypothetical protein